MGHGVRTVIEALDATTQLQRVMRAEEEKKLKVQLQKELALADVHGDMDDYWVEAIIDYRRTGKCGSVNFSTVEFIPVLSKCLAAVKS